MRRKLKIGTVTAIRCDSWGANPDDRQELVKCINGGVAVDDNGICENGETYTAEAVFNTKDAGVVAQLWKSREKAEVSYQGDGYGLCRVIVKGWKSVDKFPKYYSINLEFWRV